MLLCLSYALYTEDVMVMFMYQIHMLIMLTPHIIIQYYDHVLMKNIILKK